MNEKLQVLRLSMIAYALAGAVILAVCMAATNDAPAVLVAFGGGALAAVGLFGRHHISVREELHYLKEIQKHANNNPDPNHDTRQS